MIFYLSACYIYTHINFYVTRQKYVLKRLQKDSPEKHISCLYNLFRFTTLNRALKYIYFIGYTRIISNTFIIFFFLEICQLSKLSNRKQPTVLPDKI